ncbi:MAG TPA: glycosyltransferase [Albitalea sp.]|nr:glycosyltransferase [Albitalea sp.]
MEILLCAAGSHGDVLPFVAIGRECRARGHDVTLLANPVFKAYAESAGMAFVPVGTIEGYRDMFSVPIEHDPKLAFARIAKEFAALAPLYLAALRRAHRPGSAAVSVGPPLLFAPMIWRELDGVPCATLHLAPAAMRSNEAPPRLMPRGIGPTTPGWAARIWWWLADRYYDRHFTRPLNRWRSELGLAPLPHAIGWTDEADALIGAFPAWYGPPASDWPRQLQLAGFFLADGSESSSERAHLGDELEAFLGSGPAPVVFSAGTATRSARAFFDVSVQACRQCGLRGLLMSHVPEQLPPDLPPEVRAVPYAPYGALLPRAAAFVHHGGIGSTAQALHAGVPQLVRPVAYDQFDNSARVQRMGVALELLPAQYELRSVDAALRRLCTDAGLRERAAAVAQRMATAEASGPAAVARACDAILSLAPDDRPLRRPLIPTERGDRQNTSDDTLSDSRSEPTR